MNRKQRATNVALRNVSVNCTASKNALVSWVIWWDSYG